MRPDPQRSGGAIDGKTRLPSYLESRRTTPARYGAVHLRLPPVKKNKETRADMHRRRALTALGQSPAQIFS